MDIAEEIVTEILLRLPVKSLMKFRCVCKAWYALICSPLFVDLHLNHPSRKYRTDYLLIKRCVPNNTFLSFYCTDDDKTSLRTAAPDLPTFSHRMMQMLGPCNGIVCLAEKTGFLCNPFRIGELSNSEQAIYLCNPATRESRRLPTRPFGFPRGFACDRQALGFGFDHCTNEYKVVSVLYLQDKMGLRYCSGICKIEVYHLSSNSWIEVDFSPDTISPQGFVQTKDIQVSHPGFLLNGSFHWCAGEILSNCDMILCFDMSNDSMWVMQFPPAPNSLDGAMGHPALAVLEGSLGLILSKYMENLHDISIEIWVMMEYGVKESWMKKFTVGPIIGHIFPLNIWNNDKLLVQMEDGELASLDLTNNNVLFKKHNIYGYTNGYDIYCLQDALTMHREGLVSLTNEMRDHCLQ